jgi:phage shock protein PspC (stress-responsive transcriptional regulator)
MKKIVNINLGGYPFTIDIDAYEKMELYFSSLEKYFSNYDNPHEIIFDIEIRMAELFRENIGEKAILSSKDIEEAIKILGTPEDFSKEDIDEDEMSFDKKEKKTEEKTYRRRGEYTVGKKIFRDTKNKVIGGVCSGLSSYLGIADPIWLRILFLLFLPAGGTSFIIYIILLVIIPKAKTEADRKAMRGEPIDINTVARSIEEEINNISDQFQDLASSFKERKKARRRNRRKY